MQKIFLVLIMLWTNYLVFANNLEGKYICNGYDSKDGDMKGLVANFLIDNKNSDIKHQFYSYIFNMTHNGTEYNGSAVSSGNIVAISFNNIKDKADNGVGLATISYNLGNKGDIVEMRLNKFYYEATYNSHGIETCIKQQ